MDPKKTEKNLVKKIKEFFSKAKKTKCVLGLSGGVDSAVVLNLLVRSLGKENVIALIMPNTEITKQENIIDAQELTNNLGVKHYVIEINPFLRPFLQLTWPQSHMAKANLNARIRALILYNYSNSFDCLVAGTGNKSEFYMGYFTKYGDAAADFFPLGALLKKEVYALAKELNLPEKFIKKTPSAELWDGQEDEKEMDLKYETLDDLLQIILNKTKSKIPSEKKKIAKKIVERIKATAHKRSPAPILYP